MVTFTIALRRNVFWVEKTDLDGSRTLIEQFATEKEANRRVKALREQSAEPSQKVKT